MTLPRRCLDCGQLTTAASRCRECASARKRRRNQDAALARTLVARHLTVHGPVCPGWRRSAHDVAAGDLTADHLVAFADGGRLDDGAQVLCRCCNSSKGTSR